MANRGLPAILFLGIVLEVLREGILFSFFFSEHICIFIVRFLTNRLVGEFFGEGRGKSQREFQSFERNGSVRMIIFREATRKQNQQRDVNELFQPTPPRWTLSDETLIPLIPLFFLISSCLPSTSFGPVFVHGNKFPFFFFF